MHKLKRKSKLFFATEWNIHVTQFIYIFNVYSSRIIVATIENEKRLHLPEREALRKSVKTVLPQMKKAEIVKHFVKEGIASRTVYGTIDRFQSKQTIKDKKQTGRSSTWRPDKKTQLKRLTNNRKGVSQSS